MARPGTFKPGVSGNPGGKPKGWQEIRELAMKASPAAWKRLIQLTKSEDERVASGAIQQVLDRAVGKPAQAVTGEGGEGPIRVTLEMKFGGDRS